MKSSSVNDVRYLTHLSNTSEYLILPAVRKNQVRPSTSGHGVCTYRIVALRTGRSRVCTCRYIASCQKWVERCVCVASYREVTGLNRHPSCPSAPQEAPQRRMYGSQSTQLANALRTCSAIRSATTHMHAAKKLQQERNLFRCAEKTDGNIN